MVEVSILLPVYNGESTIARTLHSLIHQTYKNIEIIVVDDGSTDQTKKIVQDMNDARIRYFYKENGGIASTRNYAISKATGTYISFIDADDYMELDTIASLVKKAKEEDSDMVVCEYRFVYKTHQQDMQSYDFKPISLKEDSSLLYRIMPQFWNKLIKRECFMQLDTRFPEGLVFEDLYLFACMLPWVRKVSKLNKVLINYVQLEGSIMSNARNIKPTIYDFSKVCHAIYQYYQSHHLMQYSLELETLFVLNARELVDAIFKNKMLAKEDKIKVITDLLSVVNQYYPKWYRNKAYRSVYRKGMLYNYKRYIIDYLLARNIRFVVTHIVK